MPPAATAPCWAGSPTRRTVAPRSAAMVRSASRSRSDRVEASSVMSTVWSSRGRDGLLRRARNQATVSVGMPAPSARWRAASRLTAVPMTR